jgi:hypothetical protein
LLNTDDGGSVDGFTIFWMLELMVRDDGGGVGELAITK